MPEELPTLRLLWEKYKKIEILGKRTESALKLESQIHERQRQIGSSAYDFDARWAKRSRDSVSTVVIGSMDKAPEPTVRRAGFTMEDAIKIVGGKNNEEMIRDSMRYAEAFIMISVDELDKINPENTTNPARRGQGINIGSAHYNKRKENA